MDNAFERARAAYGTGAYDDATLEFLFPQLKESEDERIRKTMLQHFKNKTKEKWCNIPVKDIISWLEKQKEHQNNSDAPNESSWSGMISSSDKDKNLDEIAQDYIDGVKEYNSEPTWDLMQTAVCYGYHLGANHQVLDDEHLLSAIQVQFASHVKVENGKRYAKLTWDEFKKIIFELYSCDKQKEQKPAEVDESTKRLNENWMKQYFDEQKPADDKAFEKWIDEWWKHNKVKNPDSYDKGDEIQFDKRGFKNFCRGIRSMYAEQPHAEWDEKDEKVYDYLKSGFEYASDNPNLLNSVLSGASDATIQDYRNFIDKLKILRPQPKVEWCEEDEKMIDTIVYVLGQYIDYKAVSGTGSGYATPRYSKEIDWLKSLRSAWKPSEEQMEALERCVEYLEESDNKDADILAELYEQLKQL